MCRLLVQLLLLSSAKYLWRGPHTTDSSLVCGSYRRVSRARHQKTDKAWLVADIERKLRAAVPGHRRQCSGCLIGIPSAVYPKLFAIEFSVTFGTMTVTFDPNYESEVREAVEALDVVATPTSQKGRADQTPISASPMKAKDVEINIDIVS